ncbi:MAG: MGMT family protein [Cyanobacteriota bacterium]
MEDSLDPLEAAGQQGHGRRTFDQRVWDAVARIPVGRLATYGQIAATIGAPGAARQVGWALRRLPLPSAVPWHRVVNARGRISMSTAREGSDWLQRQQLIDEGIPVAADGSLPLKRYLWRRSEALLS